MDEWIIWIILAVVLGVAEIFTVTAALGLLGVAAFLTAATAAIGLPVPLQLLVFALSSTAGLIVIRPIGPAPASGSHSCSASAWKHWSAGRRTYLSEVTGRGRQSTHRRRGVVRARL